MKFMDDTAALRTVDLSKIKPDSAEGLCFFLNIYHTLLVHARAVLGAPTKTVRFNEDYYSVIAITMPLSQRIGHIFLEMLATKLEVMYFLWRSSSNV